MNVRMMFNVLMVDGICGFTFGAWQKSAQGFL